MPLLTTKITSESSGYKWHRRGAGHNSTIIYAQRRIIKPVGRESTEQLHRFILEGVRLP
jgi:hypothetical protein